MSWLGRRLKRNRHLAAVTAALAVVLVALAGTPGPAVLAGLGPSTAPAAGTSAPTTTQASLPDPPVAAPVPPTVGPTTEPAPMTDGGSGALAAPASDHTARVCSSDPVARAIAGVFSALGVGDTEGSLVELAAIATGCSTAEPIGPTIQLVDALAAVLPGLGLEPVDLPDLPSLRLPVPPAVVDLLGPVAPALRDGCASLSIVALVLSLGPPALGLPFHQSDLNQLLDPAAALCSLFDGQGA